MLHGYLSARDSEARHIIGFESRPQAQAHRQVAVRVVRGQRDLVWTCQTVNMLENHLPAPCRASR